MRAYEDYLMISWSSGRCTAHHGFAAIAARLWKVTIKIATTSGDSHGIDATGCRTTTISSQEPCFDEPREEKLKLNARAAGCFAENNRACPCR